MAVTYHMDNDAARSESFTYTPSLEARMLPMQLQTMGRFHCGPEYFTARDGVQTFLLLYTHAGEGEIHTAQGRFLLRPGFAAVMDGRVYGRYATGPCGHWEFSWMHFFGEGAPGYFHYIYHDKPCAVPIRDQEMFCRRFQHMQRLILAREECRDIQMCRLLIEFLTDIAVSNRAGGACGDEGGSPQISDAARFIQTHYHEPLHVEQIAEHVHLSLYHFIRRFKAQTGMTPYQYLIRYRVDRAKTMLSDEDMSIAEIAANAGFPDANSFTRSFRQWSGMTPQQYRSGRLV